MARRPTAFIDATDVTRRKVTGWGLAATAATALGVPGLLHANAPVTAEATARAVLAFLETLSEDDARRARRPFDGDTREDWHYRPRGRPGLALRRMNPAQRAATWAVLDSVLSARGRSQVDGTIRLERVLGELTDNLSYRDPDNYALVVFGDPSGTAPWGWRFEGHHLSLTVMVVPGLGLAVTPAFYGANPSTVPSRHRHSGFRLLGAEEETAFSLLRSLEGQARTRAVISDRSMGDIVSGPGREERLKTLEGVPLADLNQAQRDGVMRILGLFSDTYRAEIAGAAMARVRAAGVERLHFAWAGSPEPGRPHYFRVHGPTDLIEYDNTQGGGTHVHALWLETNNVFGRDLLRQHHTLDHGG